ncbi:hypothetical protein PTKIN_Ptkin07bG0103800 [Pterospermum kingtungense]
MSVDPSATMNYVDDDASSGSGDDVNMLDGHNKRQSVMPSSSGRRKRSRKATGDAIVDAMLEIAAASKMRASAIMKNEDRFSISKCIKVLDEMQDKSTGMDDLDLELDEMELVAAAAGYYYYNSITRQIRFSSSPSGSGFMNEVLEGPDDLCREMFRMDKHVFHKLCYTLRHRGMLRDTAGVMIEEQLAIFLNIVGHNERNRVIQERFQHSGETISRHFNNVLKAIKSLSREFLQPPNISTPPEILNSNRFFPYFKDLHFCLTPVYKLMVLEKGTYSLHCSGIISPVPGINQLLPSIFDVFHKSDGKDYQILNYLKRKESVNANLIGLVVDSEDAAYGLYKDYAHGIGFSVRKGKNEYLSGTKIIRSKDFYCSKEVKDDQWTVTRLISEHNHDLATPSKRHLLRSARSLPTGKANVIDSMVEAVAPLMASRRLRAFKRWMKSQGIECSDTLEFTDCPEQGISVRALCDLKEGDVVATIPKAACLTIKTSGARQIIESAGLDGALGLSLALMYEKSLGHDSPWAGYLQLLPPQECLPLVWTLEELDSLLCGTELHKTVKEDKALIYEDWKENILPLVYSAPQTLRPISFSVEEYFAARSLIASRSFQIDEYHGFGMVPLADLFNHKTGAEDVHITSVSSNLESDDDADSNNSDNNELNKISVLDKKASGTDSTGENSYIHSDSEYSSVSGNDPMMLQMIMVREVKSGVEVFNTYGSLGNAALLHRYGFTESYNPFDIVNIDLELVLKWGCTLFSSRYSRARLSLWRRLDFFGCVSENSEYFEISYDGEPQMELLALLYIILLPEDAFDKLDISICTANKINGCIGMILSEKHDIAQDRSSEISKELLVTEEVCSGLLSLADSRESCYGSESMDEDMEALKRCCMKETKMYHSLVLRISERRILEKLRTYAHTAKKTLTRKRHKVK